MKERGKTSFMSSIVVACRKILADSATYFEDLLPMIEDRIKTILMNHSLEEILELNDKTEEECLEFLVEEGFVELPKIKPLDFDDQAP